MHGTWIEHARWNWTGPHYQHDVWIMALVDDSSHEVQSWGVWTRLGGPGNRPASRYWPVNIHGPQAARDQAYAAAAAYRAEFAGPAEVTTPS